MHSQVHHTSAPGSVKTTPHEHPIKAEAAKARGVDLAAAYRPAVPEQVSAVSFAWQRAASVYTLHGSSATHGGGGRLPYRPVIGDLALVPNTGKYYYEIYINTDNCRVGLCTANAFVGAEALENSELGPVTSTTHPQSHQSSTAAAQPGTARNHLNPSDATEAMTAVFNAQTSQAVVNGVVRKRLWRVFTPCAGAYFAFVVDTDTGAVQLFMNKQYVGLVFEADVGLYGKTLYPCVALAGSDQHNRNIGTGRTTAVVSPACPLDVRY